MSFSTVIFTFAFLPISILAYLICPKRAKNVLLLAFSLVFYAWGQPVYLALLCLSIAFNYFAGLRIGACRDAGRGASALRSLILSVAANILILGYFKYSGFLIDNLNSLLNLSIQQGDLSLPIGISFFTFSQISYITDVYRGDGRPARKVIDFALYVSFFPKVLSGPIVQYKDFAAQLENHPASRKKIESGSRLFIIGLAKKLLIADALNAGFTALSALPQGQVSVLSAWLGALIYTAVIYFDFSGYSDMAIGLGRCFGFDIAKNFDYPYISKSATEFWRRWHISLGRFFRDYVYIPLGGNRVSVPRHVANIAVVWLLTGLWHGASWNFVAWGAFYGVLLLLEKYPLKGLISRLPAWLRHLLTMLCVVAGWVLFFSPTLTDALHWLGNMIGVGANGIVDSTGLYYLGQNFALLVVAALCSTPLGVRVWGLVCERIGKIGIRCLMALLLLGLLVLCTAAEVGSTYSSFLYFEF